MRPNASENEQISPTTTIPVARGVDSRPHLASILQEGRKSTNIHAGSGVIWGIPVKYNTSATVDAVKLKDILGDINAERPSCCKLSACGREGPQRFCSNCFEIVLQ